MHSRIFDEKWFAQVNIRLDGHGGELMTRASREQYSAAACGDLYRNSVIEILLASDAGSRCPDAEVGS